MTITVYEPLIGYRLADIFNQGATAYDGISTGNVTGQYPTAKINVGSFGDSYTDIGQVNNTTAQDIGKCSATNTPVGISSEKFASWLMIHSNGIIQPVFNGGIGGATSAQIATRIQAAHSLTSTSKSLITASVFGCDVVVVSCTVNDFYPTAVTAATSPAAIAAIQANCLAVMQSIVYKLKSLGIYAIVHSINPVGVSPTADQQAQNAATKAYNAMAKTWLSTMPGVAAYFDGRSKGEASDGGWDARYCDALQVHPNHAYNQIIYKDLSDLILTKFNLGVFRQGLPKGQNIFSNADLSASTSGLATGIVIASVNGTNVNTLPVINGVVTQNIAWTVGNTTGTDSTLNIDITLGAAGASPFVPLAIGDELMLEMDINIDDGLGGAPAVYAVSAYLRKTAGLTPTIFNTFYSTFGGTIVKYFQAPVKNKLTGGRLVIDEITAGTSGSIFSRLTVISQTQNALVNVQISNIRCVKVSTGY